MFPVALGAVSDRYERDTRTAEPRATLRRVPRLPELLPGDGRGQARLRQGTSAGKMQSGCESNRCDGFLVSQLEGGTLSY